MFISTKFLFFSGILPSICQHEFMYHNSNDVVLTIPVISNNCIQFFFFVVDKISAVFDEDVSESSMG